MGKRKPTVYLDSNIFSALYGKAIRPADIARQQVTRDWWNTEREHFECYTSSVTERELAAGTYVGQVAAVLAARRFRYLVQTSEVTSCADELVSRGIIPATKVPDAFQLSFAIVYELDYLLTWNYAHLANVAVQRVLERFCDVEDCCAPSVVSPETIPWVSYGQEIQRD
ncbi:MAG TPA: hypothetical protein VEJ63_05760 [Planctomycetota bacterium]|nr:hypothetical protein [Planctomycetota bacterium]